MQSHLNALFSSLIAVLLIVVPCSSQAQDANPSTPPAKHARSASPFGDFDMGAIYGQLIDSILTQLAKPEMAAKLARFQKQHFDALIKEGFTKDEALKIVTSTQVPLSGVSK